MGSLLAFGSLKGENKLFSEKVVYIKMAFGKRKASGGG
jgi:hypothetical protein